MLSSALFILARGKLGPRRALMSLYYGFFLNRLFNTSDLFGVGDSVDPKTQGIWMWEVPKTVSNTSHRVLVLDTEGFYSGLVTCTVSSHKKGGPYL